MNKQIYLNFGTRNALQRAYFNCTNHKGEQVDSFVLDFHTCQKHSFVKAKDQSVIADISVCGEKVLTIDHTFDKAKRKTKIFEITDSKLLFETSDFFAYEARFTSLLNLIVVRGDIKGKSSEKLFIYDIQKSEIVYFMQGNTELDYASKTIFNDVFAYPSTRRKDEVILLNLTTLQENILHLGSKKLIHRVEALGNDEYFAIDGDFVGIKFNAQGEILWKTAKMNWTEFYYAPEFLIFEEQIIITEGLKSIDIQTGKISDFAFGQQIIGQLKPYFDRTPMTNTGTMLDLKTGEIFQLVIDNFIGK